MDTSAARLQVSDALGRRIVPLDRPLVVIGRRSTADLQVAAADVSREHAEIAFDGERYWLRDRGSRFGTFVNGEPVTNHPLASGDRIRLGRSGAVELLFLQGEDTPSSGLRGAATDAPDLGQMAAIINGLRALGSGRVLDEVLTLVLDSAIDVARADRGFIMLANPAGELEFKTARGKGKITLPGTSFATSEKIPREVFRTGASRIVGDLMEGSLAGAHGGTIAVGIRHVLCVPLRVTPPQSRHSTAIRPRIIGVLYLDGRERSAMTSQDALASLEAFATQAALAIESARLYAEAAEKARIERDLRIAADIQRALLPPGSYEADFCEIAAASIPCRTVGGDFFDYLDFDDGRVGFMLGDVAGKGPPAALLAATVQSNFSALAPLGADPADTVSRINRALLRRAVDARFATIFYGVLDREGRLAYCNAGQEPPLVLRGRDRMWLEEGGPVIGLLSEAHYRYGTATLEPGDLVVVFSDGVTEAMNAAGEEFGRVRLAEAVAGCHGHRADAVLERVFAAVKQFSAGTSQADDITALVLGYRRPAAHSG